ncbi:probable glutamate receptor [Cryptotermes secundus]|uniref:probable glutamate receptor n=1 Tax=Cryptotermes secundus TaxID=105785 RepID=UPI001454DE83|nr:probable glutamate receptor [Cryptotermes secundus]
MGPLLMQFVAYMLSLSAASYQHSYKATAAGVVAHVGAHFRSTCVFLYYNQETRSMGNLELLLQTQKALTRRHLSSAIIPLDQLFVRRHLRCRSSRPLYVLISSDSATGSALLKASSSVHLSKAVWILLSSFEETDTKPMDDYFRGIYIPLDCEFLVAHRQNNDVIISEVYNLNRDLPLSRNYFGTWRQDVGLALTNISFFERRNDLQGIVMKVASMTDPPMSVVRKTDNTLILGGFFGEVWHSLEQRMNFTSDCYIPEDRAWGSLTQDGSWNGMMGMILRGEAEISVAEFAMTVLRTRVVDFTVPLFDTRNCVLIRQNGDKDVIWHGFLEPFSPQLWMLVILTKLVIVLCLKTFNHIKLRFFGRMSSESPDSHCAVYVMGVFYMQGVNRQTRFYSQRVLYLVAQLTALTVYTAYAAFLISFLTVQKFSLPFNSLRELIDIGSYRLGVLANSAHIDDFKNATDALMKEVYAKLIAPEEDHLPISIEEGMQRVCDIDNYAFMTTLEVALGLQNKITCKLSSVLGASIPESLTMTIAKRSPYRGLINYNLQAMFRSGTIKRLKQRSWPSKLLPERPLWHSVDFSSILPIFAILGAGFVASLLLQTAEILVAGRRNRVSTV